MVKYTYITQNVPFLHFLSVHFSGTMYLHNTALLSPLCSSRTLPSSETTLHPPKTTLPHSFFSPEPSKFQSFCVYELDCTGYLVYTESYHICPFTSGFFTHTIFKVHLCCNVYRNLVPFEGWIIFHGTSTLHRVYSFICGWPFGFFLLSGYRDRSCCPHWPVLLLSDKCGWMIRLLSHGGGARFSAGAACQNGRESWKEKQKYSGPSEC